MGEHWHRTRIDEGWEIRDGLHALVAAIPDEMHEQRANADLIVAAPDVAEQRDRLVDALKEQRAFLKRRLDELRTQCHELVMRVVKDAGEMGAAPVPPEQVPTSGLSLSLWQLAEAQHHVSSARVQLERVQGLLKVAGSRAARRAPLSSRDA